MSSREFYGEDDILTLDPALLTDLELVRIIEDANRYVVWVQDEQRTKIQQATTQGQRIPPLRQARNAFQQELDSRG